MFAVNGPSGPTSRHERRVPTDQEVQARKDAMEKKKAKCMESFFTVRKPAALQDTTNKTVAKEEMTTQNGDKSAPAIFKGCNVYFTGRTGKVSAYFLTKLVEEHGGNISSAHMKTRVTHVVAANLNGSKADRVIKSCGKIICVRPEWILDSVKRKKRQPEFNFLVYKDSAASTTTSEFFKTR